MHLSPVCAFALLSSIPTVLGQSILNQLSFGQSNRGPQSTSIPDWMVKGNDNYKPQILSDRIILTPPHPGNRRGGMWSQNTIPTNDWTAELEFRVSGPNNAGGNLQFWYVKDKQPANELASIYTVGQFDGLALVLDQYHGSAGTVRAFLNDGSTDYKSRQDVSKLAFAHCQYTYRNLGRMSKMKIQHTAGGLEVLMDDKLCLRSDKIQLPPNSYFGISAASAENPDSIEVSKLTVMNGPGGSTQQQQQQQQPPPQQHQQNQPPVQQQQQQQQFMRQPQQAPLGGQQQGSPPTPQAEDLKSVFTVLQNLQSTVQDLSNRVNAQTSNIQSLANKAPASGGAGQGLTTDQVNTMARRLEEMEKTMEKVKQLVEDKGFIDHLTEVHDRIEDIEHHMRSALPTSSDLTNLLKTSSPRLGFFIFIVIAFQGMLAGSYIVYKRRRANSPKKLL